MHVGKRRSWQLSESEAISEGDYWNRRKFLKAVGLGTGSLAGIPNLIGATAGFPTTRNPKYSGEGLDVTDYDLVSGYNNFYEFSYDKDGPAKLANKGWKTEPWTLEVGGLVDNPLKLDVNDLIKRVGGIEQRVYRFRCVEAWSMVIPWDGFQLSKLLQLASPKSGAKFVKFTTFFDPKVAPGQRGGSIDWPYVEALTLAEAMNELTLLATGIFGKPMPNQNGAPIRLVVPWKYGFKSIKSIVRIDLVDTKPVNTWQALQPSEYGFYANVNPKVDHPRWSQGSERVIGGGFFSGRKDTLMFNGYEEQVAGLYDGLDLRRNY
ncbi:protein-methionine-sulfoxide reductase catalytic subunit MsrP [Pelagicoccus sp. SDUM812005]|uniref:protein-methionine-sulfoxide reductase catalytic subunit MsrP n=1 Tax=Pelagicoccus sp. SDUM812005 TaxID=3041257 RepID=UPI00280F2F86|nr:protein-methionine-sulfoxide reductase catalytic subunit MsrP [Pelagicoccus sp. SDUM812005]MDQ8179189.1 protein-methionine-sulfoxide reductase catalytic subunit MsrP [Pelagicoccus sp. SDUM812005]